MTGSKSSFPITRLASKYKDLQKNGVFLSNKKSIEIIRERIEQLLGRIDAKDAPDRFQKLYKLWQKYRAQDANHSIEAPLTAREIDDEFEKAYHDYAAWKQIFDAVDLDRALIESEVKIAKSMHAMLTAEDAYEMIAEIFGVILRLEDDPQKLKAYQYEFAKLIGEGSVIEAEGSD